MSVKYAAAEGSLLGASAMLSIPEHEMETDSQVVNRAGYAKLFNALGQNRDWGHDVLKIQDMWSTFECRGKGVKVSVLDTGIDRNHEDLKITLGMDFSNSSTGWNDVQGHGTHCAGIIGAQDNGVGVVGVAPECDLIACKVLGDNGSGYISSIVAGIRWSADNADIISMSLGGSGNIDSSMRAAIDYAIQKGVLVIAAAGNSGTARGAIGAPGIYTPCVTVGAIDVASKIASFSSRGTQVDVCAPGVKIISTYPGNRYTALSGTSMATPYVSGVAAVFLEKARKMGVPVNQQIFENYAKSSALDLGASGHDVEYGSGVIRPNLLIGNFVRDNAPAPPPPSSSEPVPPPPTAQKSVPVRVSITLANGDVLRIDDVVSVTFV